MIYSTIIIDIYEKRNSTAGNASPQRRVLLYSILGPNMTVTTKTPPPLYYIHQFAS